MLARSIFTVFFLLSAPTLAQTALDAATQRQGKKAVASFECAVLAAEGTERIEDLASVLALQGYADYLPFAKAIIPHFGADTGPMGGFISQVSPEFMAGLAFGDAKAAMDAVLNETAPFDGSATYDTIRLMRDIAADGEFGRRNCEHLIR